MELNTDRRLIESSLLPFEIRRIYPSHIDAPLLGNQVTQK